MKHATKIAFNSIQYVNSYKLKRNQYVKKVYFLLFTCRFFFVFHWNWVLLWQGPTWFPGKSLSLLPFLSPSPYFGFIFLLFHTPISFLKFFPTLWYYILIALYHDLCTSGKQAMAQHKLCECWAMACWPQVHKAWYNVISVLLYDHSLTLTINLNFNL